MTTMTTTTYSPKAADVQHDWFIVDANGHTLGRLATEVARVLRGKHKPTFAEHMDMGDYVIVINAEKIAVTGKKPTQKKYYRHSNYPGGFKTPTYAEVMKKFPIRIIETAVKGMLPKNRLGKQQYLKLKVYRRHDAPARGAEAGSRWRSMRRSHGLPPGWPRYVVRARKRG